MRTHSDPEADKPRGDSRKLAKPACEDDPHGNFRDLCLVYCDFNRSVFREEIETFIASASDFELTEIYRAVARRRKKLPLKARGRPRGTEDPRWLQLALTEARQRLVLRWEWSQITESSGLKPTEANIRTLQRRHNDFAYALWKALPPDRRDWAPERIVADRTLRRWLRSLLGLPFDSHPKECEKIVIGLLCRFREKFLPSPPLKIEYQTPAVNK